MPVPAKPDPDWSDSEDEDERADVETSVLLGIPDGEIEKQEDVDDAAVSRIGGHPTFLTKNEPPFISSQCKHCSFPMELLVQLWCPFENSPMDRALYLFGCARGECQQKAGSIRAFRGLRYNASYAAKLEKQLAKQREKEAARLKEKELLGKKQAAAKANPFSMNKGTGSSGGLFGASPAFGSGIGSQLFGEPARKSTSTDSEPTDKVDDEEEAQPPPESESEPEDSELESESESDKSILAVAAHTPSPSSSWSAAPAYQPPLYLSTAAEYVPSAPKPKLPPSTSDALYDDDDANVVSGIGKSKKAEAKRAEKEKEDAKAWNSALEGYEDSLEVDKVFEKFARIAGYEGEQCIRYELGGIPLPYASDAVFKSLFPSPSTSTSAISAIPARRTYDPKNSLVSPCPRCGGPRTFECQLMPHLISVLNSSRSSAPAKPAPSTDEEDPEVRRRELESLLHGSGSKSKDGEKGKEGIHGMEWGTCLVFSCANDCRVEEGKKEVNELWAEELVLVQWDV